MNENEYIEKWVEKSITLAEWLSARNIDHWEWINQFDLSESEIEEIENHQNYLFNQAVKNTVNNEIQRYHEVVKINVFTEQLRLLELFLASTKVEPFLIELLEPIVRIRDKDYLFILKEYQNIRGRRYNDFKKDFSINQQGSFLNGYYFTASIIWEYKTEIQKYLIKVSPQQAETKTDKLKIELGKYGFFELSKVKQLSEPNKQRLTELISTNDLPYSIAMFDYLGFLKYLKAEHFTTDYKLFKAVANWFEVAERAVKGNIYVLNEVSKENRTRYTADQQKQTVQKNYEALK